MNKTILSQGSVEGREGREGKRRGGRRERGKEGRIGGGSREGRRREGRRREGRRGTRRGLLILQQRPKDANNEQLCTKWSTAPSLHTVHHGKRGCTRPPALVYFRRDYTQDSALHLHCLQGPNTSFFPVPVRLLLFFNHNP